VSKHTLRGIDFRDVDEVVGERGRCAVTMVMKDGERKLRDSYPGEDFYQRCLSWLAMARKEPREASDIPEKTEPEPLEAVDNWEELCQVEYDAWLLFMSNFYRAAKTTEDEVNEPGGRWDETFIALRTWGERIAQLRRPQAEVLELDVRGFPSRRAS
jgi:hypothetical protein